LTSEFDERKNSVKFLMKKNFPAANNARVICSPSDAREMRCDYQTPDELKKKNNYRSEN